MGVTSEFAHGIQYGDYSGVVFYGEPTNGFWLDRLDVSKRFIGPLFRAILDRAEADAGGKSAPHLVYDWITLTGWMGSGVAEVSRRDAEEMVTALGEVDAADLAPHVSGAGVEECLRCAAVVREFIAERLTRSGRVFIEDD